MSTETVWNRRLACAGARRSSSAVWREIKVAAEKRAETECPYSVRYHTSYLLNVNLRTAIKPSEVWLKLTSFTSAFSTNVSTEIAK